MTLVVALIGKKTIWLMADRRLSYNDRAPKDDGRKIMCLETPDGVAILGYAGLGATARGTEPSDWMSAVLRGRDFPLERSLEVLANAMREQLPVHLLRLPPQAAPAHSIVAAAFVNSKPAVYTLNLELTPDRKQYRSALTRLARQPLPTTRPFPHTLVAGGSGEPLVRRDRLFLRSLMYLMKANERGVLSAAAVADHLAKWNLKISQQVADGSVGRRCIVVWREHRKGGAHRFYDGAAIDRNEAPIPMIGGGLDIQALAQITLSDMMDRLNRGEPAGAFKKDEIAAKLARIPTRPDEKLR